MWCKVWDCLKGWDFQISPSCIFSYICNVSLYLPLPSPPTTSVSSATCLLSWWLKLFVPGKETLHQLYGTRVAVLAGDFMFAQSSWCLANLENLEVIKLISQVNLVPIYLVSLWYPVDVYVLINWIRWSLLTMYEASEWLDLDLQPLAYTSFN